MPSNINNESGGAKNAAEPAGDLRVDHPVEGKADPLISKKLRILGVAWGDPWSVENHSGVPMHLFSEFKRLGILAGVANARQIRMTDIFRGGVDWYRTFRDRSPRRNAIWRFLPENIELLTKRFRERGDEAPEHDAILQFGVAGIPSSGKGLMAHVEMSIVTVLRSDVYARSYGYNRLSEPVMQRAIEGERKFFEACALIWTNSKWTAEGLREQEVPEEKIRIYPPASGMPDPGPVDRKWDRCNILFVGRDWIRKGGHLLTEAFELVRKEISAARLTIIGCQPDIRVDGVTVLGFLDSADSEQALILGEAFEQATIFCMPSLFDTTGMVYMEAALYGLPLVMLMGQGRGTIFPSHMAVHLDKQDVKALASSLIELAKDPERMKEMGSEGRKYVLANYTWPVIADKIYRDLAGVCNVNQSQA